MDKLRRHSRRVIIGIVGGLIILIGVVLIPYPGPGWLVVFSGFAVLSTEYAFAARTLEWLKEKYELWKAWLKVQPLIIQLLVLAFTGIVIVSTVWLLNGFGILNMLLHLNQSWLISPLFR